ncbi:MAG: methylated-DNA--[protein]-cysteine S-methyltransferase [Planctomycetota bacterium]
MSKSKKPKYYDAWPTAWGPMGALAADEGITGVILPHYQMDDLLALMAWNHQDARRDSGPFERFAAHSREYFSGSKPDFREVTVDLPGENTFFGKVYRAAREIPYGQTISYKGLAMEIGQEQAARAIATAMSKNPTPLVVPCHRVIYSNGRPGGFSAAGGEDLKQRMIAFEAKHS